MIMVIGKIKKRVFITSGAILALGILFFTGVVSADTGASIAEEGFFDAFFERMVTSWPWYVTRASGLVAVFVLLALIFSGIGLVTGHTYKYIEPLKAWEVHRTLGIVLIASVIIHIGVLLFDSYEPFSIFDILIPFVFDGMGATLFSWSVGSFYIALGIVAFYGLIVITVSSLLWIDSKPQSWRKLHYVSYVCALAVYLHVLFAGTDFKGGLGRVYWVILGIVLLIGIFVRIYRIGTTSQNK